MIENCIQCALKHMLDSKTFLMEAIELGYKGSVSVDKIDSIIQALIEVGAKQKSRP